MLLHFSASNKALSIIRNCSKENVILMRCFTKFSKPNLKELKHDQRKN